MTNPTNTNCSDSTPTPKDRKPSEGSGDLSARVGRSTMVLHQNGGITLNCTRPNFGNAPRDDAGTR
jgi:hypothetical protein